LWQVWGGSADKTQCTDGAMPQGASKGDWWEEIPTVKEVQSFN